MLRISERPLADSAHTTLRGLQDLINAIPDYPAKVKAAKKAWDTKTSTNAKAEAFREVRQTLASMCIGPVRCAYCEDSLADEIEHIRPKNFFPGHVFEWENYLLACGPCNGHKGSRYAVVSINDTICEFFRAPRGVVEPPSAGPPALIDPRAEDPLNFFELDLGGTTPKGKQLQGTFEFLPSDIATAGAQARAVFSIKVLGLNREVLRVAREDAFVGFQARLRAYVEEKERGASLARLDYLRNNLLSTTHLTVFAEMRRQRGYLPGISDLFGRAPEAENWPLYSSVT